VALKGLEERTGTSLKNITFYAGKGCKECDNLGYKGRIGIYELFGLNDETKKMILDGASEADLKKAAVKFGMKNLFLTGLEKVTAGFTTIEEVLKVSFIEKDL